MLPYFKGYAIAVCAIAVALPLIASTVWPLVTGQIIASSLGGLALQFLLFFGGLLVGYRIFERRAESVVDGYLKPYNDGCNPKALLDRGHKLACAITFPCNAQAAWFMGYYGQACLDEGRTEDARTIEEGLRQSISAQKKPDQKCAIIVSLVPLAEKLSSASDALALIDEGLALISTSSSAEASAQRTYLESQRAIMGARMAGDHEKLMDLDERVASSGAYPMRLRVEYAWDAAASAFKMGSVGEESRFLGFVADHGGTLALAEQARSRLAAMAA